MIGRITDRATFLDLARASVVRRGSVRLRFVPDDGSTRPSRRDEQGLARVAFAIGKHVGNAVMRNRVRRRLRAALVEVDRHRIGGLPAGAYLLGADRSVADLPFPVLVQVTNDAVEAACVRSVDASGGRRP